MEIPEDLLQAAVKERMREYASEGGKARAKKLSKQQRRDIAMMGVKAKARKRKNGKINGNGK